MQEQEQVGGQGNANIPWLGSAGVRTTLVSKAPPQRWVCFPWSSISFSLSFCFTRFLPRSVSLYLSLSLSLFLLFFPSFFHVFLFPESFLMKNRRLLENASGLRVPRQQLEVKLCRLQLRRIKPICVMGGGTKTFFDLALNNTGPAHAREAETGKSST